MDTESPGRPRISKVWARNFKSMEDLVLDLSPLTVLVGPNASGKSNIADIPKFVSDAVRDGLDAALTSRGHAALKHSRRKKDISLGVEVELREFKVSYDFTIQVNANGPHRVKHEVLDLKPEDPEALGSVLEIKGGRAVKPPGVLPDFFVQAMTRDSQTLGIPTAGPLMLDSDSRRPLARYLVEFWESLRSIQSYHIFPNVLRSPQPTEARHPLAENGGNLASVLQGMRSDYPDAFQDILSTLGQMVPAIVDVDVIHAGGHLHLEFTHKMANAAKPTVLNSAQESDGTLRLLGILTALYQDSPPGFTAPSVIVVEEPELAVHPGALAVLAEVMTETARRTSLLVTTHSPQLLDRLPVECIRVVESRDSVTYAGPVASYQQEAVKEHLFTPGEIHTIDGLQFDRQVG